MALSSYDPEYSGILIFRINTVLRRLARYLASNEACMPEMMLEKQINYLICKKTKYNKISY